MLSNVSPHGWQTRARCGDLFADQELCETRRGVGLRHALSIPLLLIREPVTRGNEALVITRHSRLPGALGNQTPAATRARAEGAFANTIPQSRNQRAPSSSATRNASSSDCMWFSRGSQSDS